MVRSFAVRERAPPLQTFLEVRVFPLVQSAPEVRKRDQAVLYGETDVQVQSDDSYGWCERP